MNKLTPDEIRKQIASLVEQRRIDKQAMTDLLVAWDGTGAPPPEAGEAWGRVLTASNQIENLRDYLPEDEQGELAD